MTLFKILKRKELRFGGESSGGTADHKERHGTVDVALFAGVVRIQRGFGGVEVQGNAARDPRVEERTGVVALVGMQVVVGVPIKGGQPQQPDKTDPSLALPMQKLDQLRNQDSPAKLFQMLDSQEHKPRPKPGRDW